jgi:cytoskeletal protein CcmA (bactofilin family)
LKTHPLLSKIGALLAALWLSQAAAGATFVQGNQFVSDASETLTEEMWISGQSITLSGQALDDLFLAGPLLDLRGEFHGDLWACSERVIASGRFHDHLRLAAQTLELSGTLDRSLAVAATTLTIAPQAVIGGNLLVLGDYVLCEGTVNGTIRITARTVTLGGTLRGDIHLVAEDVVVLPNTVIEGTLRYTAPKEIILPPSARHSGQLIRVAAPVAEYHLMRPGLAGHFFFGLAALLAGVVFCAIFPRYTAGATQALRTAPIRCFFTGAAACILMPATALLFCLTLIGMPLGLLITLFFLILLYLGKIIAGLRIGELLLRRQEAPRRRGGVLAAGLFVIYGLSALTPLKATGTVAALFGLGALLRTLFKRSAGELPPSAA